MLSVSPASIAANPGDANNLNWSFNSAPQAFDFLAAGESLTLTYTVKAADGHGVDSPDGHRHHRHQRRAGHHRWRRGQRRQTLAETNAALSTSGTLTVTDADLSDA